MKESLKNKIRELLISNGIQAIINADGFYFQKANDALHDFLQLDASEETKKFLLTNRKEYNELKQLFEDSQDLAVFGKLLFTVISYCDSNAHKKRELNAYEDKRVLALAFVRMNNWVEQLITYKFEGQMAEGSVKNAVEYLLNPIDNFTMLSENHRSQISQNLFEKAYSKETFKEDFLNFFSEFPIAIKNPENYTHILTRLVYGFETDWKDNLIGLISPDSTGWQENAIKDSENGNYITLWNHKKPNGTYNTLKLLRQCIDENGFFRVFYTSSFKVNYVAEIVDFVTNQNELNKANWPKNYCNIESYKNAFSDYKDGSKTASWVYLARKIEKVDPDNYLDFQYYKSNSYPSVGCQSPIISYKNSLEINYENQMNEHINLLHYKKQIILQGPPGTGKTREAKLIAKEMLGLDDVKGLKNNDQFKLIQFHPSYTYEDFVRGIVAKPNPDGDGIIYDAENKTLGAFAMQALKNHKESKVSFTEKPINSSFEAFVSEVIRKIDEEGKYMISDKIYIYSVENHRFKYKGDNWQALPMGLNMNFSELKKIINLGLGSRQEINKNENLNSLTRQDATYFQNVIERYNEFVSQQPVSETKNTSLKKYVLIIDEINRANLSSVLGELIYALEYRGEAVESMYAVEDDNKLILPPNLYIIGTMNTADRSVGHIDYAIRRRFAFVDVLPKDLSDDATVNFDTILFTAVKELFTTDDYKTHSTYLSKEFDSKDVALGHSYFIDKSTEIDGAPMAIRLECEIKPILFEYVKDGVLIGEDIKSKIEKLEASI